MSSYHLAQINIAHAVADLDDPQMAGFIAQIEAINQLAERSPGFVWRYQTAEGGSSTYANLFEDKRLLFNLSVWENPQTLRDYVYDSAHLELLRAKAQWFAKPEKPHLAMWWIPAGTLPEVDDAIERLHHLQEHGASERAFNYRSLYPAPQPAAESL